MIGPSPGSSAAIASLAASSARRQSCAYSRSPRSTRAAQPGGELGRVGAQDRRRPAGRLVPAAVGVDDDLVGAGGRRARRAAACWSASRRSAGRGRGSSGCGSARRAAAGRRRRSRASGRGGRSGAGRSARRGSGSRRPRRGGRAARAARGRAGGRRRSRRRSPRRCAWRPPRAGSSEGSRSIGVTAVSGRPSRPSSASGSVAVTAPSTGIGASGSRQGRLRWTGPGRGSPRAAAKARQAVER